MISVLIQQLHQVYQQAESIFDQTQHQFNISEEFLNATLQEYATDNVGAIQSLYMNIYDGWLRLFCNVKVFGNYFELSVDLKLIKTSINHTEQLFVFQQISDTQIIKADYANIFHKIAVKAVLFTFRNILRKDPLGNILGLLHKKFDIGIHQEGGLFHLNLMRWLGKNRSVLNVLKKVNIVDAELHTKKLQAKGKAHLDNIVNLSQMFQKYQS